MFRLFLILFFITKTLLAIPTVNVDTDTVNIRDFKMGYFIDKSEKLT